MQFDTLFPVHNPSKRAHPQNKIRAPRKTAAEKVTSSSKQQTSENVLHNHFLSRALSKFCTLQIKYLAITVSIYLIKVAN